MTAFWSILLIVLGATSVAAILTGRMKETRDLFLVANRRVGLLLGMLTVTATWTQAPAIFASGMYAYKSPTHFLMFWLPNVLALIVPVYVVMSMRRVSPDGYTGPQYMGAVYGPIPRTIGFALQMASLIGVVTLTLVGISQWLNPLLNIPHGVLVVTFGLFAFAWVLFSGLPGALVGDRVKVFIIVLLALGVGYLWWRAWGTLPAISSHKLLSDEPVGGIIWDTGVVLTISLIGAVLCNPDVGERNFALVPDARIQRNVYFGSAALFGLVTLAFGSLGILAVYAIPGTVKGFPAFAILKEFVGNDIVVVVSVGLSVILTAALASYIASAGDLMAIEGFQRFYRWRLCRDPSDRQVVWAARTLMPTVVLIAVLLTMIPNVSIPKLLESFAVIRGEMIFPMLVAPVLLRFGAPSLEYGKSISVGMIVGLIGGILLTYSGDMFAGSDNILVTDGKPIGALFALIAPVVFFLGRFFMQGGKNMTRTETH